VVNIIVQRWIFFVTFLLRQYENLSITWIAVEKSMPLYAGLKWPDAAVSKTYDVTATLLYPVSR
jgi:hypothetical protein